MPDCYLSLPGQRRAKVVLTLVITLGIKVLTIGSTWRWQEPFFLSSQRIDRTVPVLLLPVMVYQYCLWVSLQASSFLGVYI